VLSAFAVTHLVPAGTPLSLFSLIIAAIVLDFGMTANLTLDREPSLPSATNFAAD
jgi:hypothetical protein